MSSPHFLKSRGHAVVIGASISGLLTARVLTNHFERVTLLDQDALPDSPTPRRGAPQASHLHNLMALGSQLCEQLFPGIVSELESQGALSFEYGENTYLLFHGYELPRFRSGVRSVACSRALLEWCLLRRIRALPRVSVQPNTYVTRLQEGATGGVRGVSMRQGESTAPEQLLEADLVVDASGRGSRAPQWLQALGRRRAPEQIIRPGLTYVTRWFRVPEDRWVEQLGDWVLAGTLPAFPHIPYSAAICRVENGQMIITLSGYGNHQPSDDEAGFVEFSRRIPLPALLEMVREAEPLSPIHKFRGGINQWRHYEQVENWPEGFVVLGDAACVFNPAYGQGMTVAAMSAILLGECLAEGSANTCHTFQKRLAEQNQLPWSMVSPGDSLWERGERATLAQRLGNEVQQQIIGSLFATEEGTRRFFEVMHMLRSPKSLREKEGLVQVGRGLVKRLARQLPLSPARA